jgi:hypothetical protein
VTKLRLLPVGLRRVLTVAVASLSAVVMLASPALAHHKPVMLDDGDVLPWNGPLVLDGTDAVGLMGTVPHAGAVRSAQLNILAGQELQLLYSIPDQAPENALTDDQLPLVVLIRPNLTATTLTPDMRESVGAGGINVIKLKLYFEEAVAGTYSIVVIGRAPARFLVSIGDEHNHTFDGVERAEVATLEQVIAFFSTPPS